LLAGPKCGGPTAGLLRGYPLDCESLFWDGDARPKRRRCWRPDRPPMERAQPVRPLPKEAVRQPESREVKEIESSCKRLTQHGCAINKSKIHASLCLDRNDVRQSWVILQKNLSLTTEPRLAGADFPNASLFAERRMDCPPALWNEVASVQSRPFMKKKKWVCGLQGEIQYTIPARLAFQPIQSRIAF
jgi:hypothetical protein